MAMITCENCGKRYDDQKDDFCPKCGAFNQPRHRWGEDAQGNVVRVDGINESGHEDSFVHQEVHREKAQRRQVGLDWRGSQGARRPAAGPKPQRPAGAPPVQRPAAGAQRRSGGGKTQVNAAKWVVYLVAGIILLNVLFSILSVIFSVF